MLRLYNRIRLPLSAVNRMIIKRLTLTTLSQSVSRSTKNLFLILPLFSAAPCYFSKCLIYDFKRWLKLVPSKVFTFIFKVCPVNYLLVKSRKHNTNFSIIYSYYCLLLPIFFKATLYTNADLKIC